MRSYELVDTCCDLLEKYGDKIVLPIDVVVSKEINENVDCYTKLVSNILDDEISENNASKAISAFL